MAADSHHLVMGRREDFLTGEMLDDTHDERYRQKLARFLVQELGYEKTAITPRLRIEIQANDKTAGVVVDFLVHVNQVPAVLVKYAPGSLVTRRLSNLAVSRLVTDHKIPIVVTTNGEDAEVINGVTGKVMGQGLGAIPKPEAPLLLSMCQNLEKISVALVEKASRIAFACEIDGSCALDNDFKCSSWYCYPDASKT